MMAKKSEEIEGVDGMSRQPWSRIFLSSTAADLTEHRARIAEAIERLGQQTIRMETFGARPGTPLEQCRHLAAASDALVVCVGYRYGSVPGLDEGGDAKKSITWWEVEAALAAGKPVFAFLVDAKAHRRAPTHESADGQALERFREFLERSTTRELFTTPEDLAMKVTASLSRWLLEHYSAEARLDLPRSSAPFFVPFMRNPDFVGRDPDLHRLHTLLRCGTSLPVGINPAGLSGMGGIGKTQLAVEYAYRYRESYPGGVLWINAAEPLMTGFAQLGRRLAQPASDLTRDDEIKVLADYLRQQPHTLLILDNLADPAELNMPVGIDFVPAALACYILFTTRRRDLGHFRSFTVNVLDEDAAMKLLLREPGRRAALDPGHPVHHEALAICAMVGFLPLALEIAGAHLAQRPTLPLSQYREELLRRGALPVLDDRRGRLRSQDLPTRHEAAVAATLAAQWSSVENEDSLQLLLVAGQLAPTVAIPVARLSLLAGLKSDHGWFESSLSRGLKELEEASLVEELREGQVRLHPLVHEFAAQKVPSGKERDTYRARLGRNLWESISKMEVLEAEVASRGVDAVLDDLRVGISVAPEFSASQKQLHTLKRVIDREAHVLRGWEPEADPTFLAQQTHACAVRLGESAIAASVEQGLAKRGSYLRLRWQTQREALALVRTLTGHTGAVTTISVLPDGKRVLSGSHDSTLRLWDIEAGQTLRIFQEHQASVESVSIAPDGTKAVSLDRSGKVVVWNIADQWTALRIYDTDSPVSTVAMMSDGKRFVVGHDRLNIVRIYDIVTAELLQTHQFGEERISGISGIKDILRAARDQLIFILTSEAIALWEPDKDHHRVLRIGTSPNALAMTPDGSKLLVASSDSTVRVSSTESFREIGAFQGHGSWVSAVATTPDGKHAISGDGYHGCVKYWSIDDCSEVSSLPGHTDMIRAVAVTPDGKLGLSASNDATIKVWDLKLRDKALSPSGYDMEVISLAVTPDGRQAVTCAQNYSGVRVWDLENNKQHRFFLDRDDPAVTIKAVAVAPDGVRGVSGGYTGHNDQRAILYIWNLKSGHILKSLRGGAGESVSSIQLSQSGDIAVAEVGKDFFGRSKAVWIVKLSNGRKETAELGNGRLVGMISQAGVEQFLWARDDGHLELRELPTGRLAQSVELHFADKDLLAVTPDGRFLAVASMTGRLAFYTCANWRKERETKVYRGPIRTMAVSPDGQLLLTGSDDLSLRVWSITTAEEVASFVDRFGFSCAVFACSGSRVIAGDKGGTVTVLELLRF